MGSDARTRRDSRRPGRQKGQTNKIEHLLLQYFPFLAIVKQVDKKSNIKRRSGNRDIKKQD
jgi:hypothetical protein